MQVRQVIDRLNEDIAEVISHFIEVKQSGARFTACCPFHDEKTPSFHITPSLGIFKCFGCGEGGDAITFIQKHEGVEFREAVDIGAKKLNLQVDWGKDKDFNEEEFKHQEAIRIVLSKAASFFQEQLIADKKATQYLDARGYKIETDDLFQIGYAPAGNKLLEWATKQSIRKELLIEAGLVKQKDGRDYDFFRERIMFPICNKSGKVIAFTGRYVGTNTKAPKYLNSSDTDVFTKGNELFALNIARAAIRKHDRAYLVEGNFDVKRLHSINIENTIAPCGTALTREQAMLLKLYTNKVTLIYDGDAAGKKAIIRNAEILIKEQFNVMVIALPEDKDPDDFFESHEHFEEFAEKTNTDYIIYKVEQNTGKCKNPAFKSDFIKDTAGLIACYDEPSMHEVYLEAVGSIIKPKKAWQDQLRQYVADKAPIEKRSYIPKQVDLAEYQERGFYVDHNSYFFADKKGEPVKRSNFVLAPIMHIQSTINAKRLYEVKNEHGLTYVVEIPQRDMVSQSAFKVRIESLGNFWWDGSESDLNRLKRWLYEKTESCEEIEQMGFHEKGFYVWGNGIFNGEFTPVDSYGLVKHNKKSYYIPAFSRIFENEKNLFEFERRFINLESNVNLREYSKKYTEVFGDNGKIALCFYIASLYRDIIVRKFEKFPILNLFGPKGAGKNACAEALLYLFGKKQKAPNLHNTSKAALADHVATTRNGLCILDEYRNDLEMEKREFLKGLWDGVGRTRMNMDKDKKKETTSVDQAVIVCGQQMATADIALFSRFIVLGFSQTEYSEQEKANFEALKEVNRRGLTQITNQLLKLRSIVKDNYTDEAQRLSDKMMQMPGCSEVESRIFDNWLMVMAVYTTLADQLELSWDTEELIKLAVNLMKEQNKEIKKNDDLGQFWLKVEMLANSNLIFEEGDYKIIYTNRIIQRYNEKSEWKTNVIEWIEPKKVLYITTSRIFSLYKRYCNQEGEKPLPEASVGYYLKNSKAFLFETKKESFKKIDPKTGRQEETESGKKKRTSTTALVFDYEKVNIDIERNTDEAPTNDAASEVTSLDPPSTPQMKINMNVENSAPF